jgi:putative transposase
MTLPELRRLKDLEEGNAKLKRIVSQQVLDIELLKDINSKKW